MGQGFRPPGQKSGLTFDHILSRLQGELQKSKETGAELQNLTGALCDVHNTLGGTVPQNLPSFNGAHLPPVRSPQHEPPVASTSAPPTSEVPSSSSLPPAALGELQSQLHDTQSSLASHVDKVRALESVFKEHEAIKREVSALRELVEHSKASFSHPNHGHAEGESDDDDARSIVTVIPHELERVEEEDEEQLHLAEESDEDRSRRRAELGRPRTPEPSSLGILEEDEVPGRNRERSSSPPAPTTAPGVDELTARLTTLSNQLESALLLSSSLQAQHTAAQTTIAALEQKVSQLETLVQTSTAAPPPAPVPASILEGERESLTQMLADWKKSVEGQWTAVREEWASERERLASAREEWESKVKSMESNLGSASAKVDAGLASLALMQTQHRMANGDVMGGMGFPVSRNMGTGSGGLVTPPSPRSLSADSNRPRRQRKKGSRGRSGSRSHSRPRSEPEPEVEVEAEAGAESDASSIRRPYSPSLPGDSSNSEADADSVRLRKDSTDSKDSEQSPQYLATPESSVHRAPITSTPSSYTSALAATTNSNPDTTITESESGVKGPGVYSDAVGTHFSFPIFFEFWGAISMLIQSLPLPLQHITNVSTAVGVLVLTVAAAAVLWRVKPE